MEDGHAGFIQCIAAERSRVFGNIEVTGGQWSGRTKEGATIHVGRDDLDADVVHLLHEDGAACLPSGLGGGLECERKGISALLPVTSGGIQQPTVSIEKGCCQRCD